MNEQELRKQIIEYGLRMSQDHLIQSTWGNISCRLDENSFLITPSGVDYAKITPQEIVKVHLDDFSYEGENKPSSEKTLHGLIYQAYPQIGGLVHVHSGHLQVYAACRQDVVKDGEILFHCANYGVSGSGKLARNTCAALKDKQGVIMANHGFVGVGKDLAEAYSVCLQAEEDAKELLKAE